MLPTPEPRVGRLLTALYSRADAIAGLDVIEQAEDLGLIERLCGKLRVFLSVL